MILVKDMQRSPSGYFSIIFLQCLGDRSGYVRLPLLLPYPLVAAKSTKNAKSHFLFGFSLLGYSRNLQAEAYNMTDFAGEDRAPSLI